MYKFEFAQLYPKIEDKLECDRDLYCSRVKKMIPYMHEPSRLAELSDSEFVAVVKAYLENDENYCRYLDYYDYAYSDSFAMNSEMWRAILSSLKSRGERCQEKLRDVLDKYGVMEDKL